MINDRDDTEDIYRTTILTRRHFLFRTIPYFSLIIVEKESRDKYLRIIYIYIYTLPIRSIITKLEQKKEKENDARNNFLRLNLRFFLVY